MARKRRQRLLQKPSPRSDAPDPDSGDISDTIVVRRPAAASTDGRPQHDRTPRHKRQRRKWLQSEFAEMKQKRDEGQDWGTIGAIYGESAERVGMAYRSYHWYRRRKQILLAPFEHRSVVESDEITEGEVGRMPVTGHLDSNGTVDASSKDSFNHESPWSYSSKAKKKRKKQHRSGDVRGSYGQDRPLQETVGGTDAFWGRGACYGDFRSIATRALDLVNSQSDNGGDAEDVQIPIDPQLLSLDAQDADADG